MSTPRFSSGARGDALGLAAQAQQDVLGAHVFAAQAGRLFARRAHDVLGAFRESFPHVGIPWIRR
jgi:hypothetical protein